ncbi:hypothetical protein ABN067_23440, partial [Providencia rettgeri]
MTQLLISLIPIISLFVFSISYANKLLKEDDFNNGALLPPSKLNKEIREARKFKLQTHSEFYHSPNLMLGTNATVTHNKDNLVGANISIGTNSNSSGFGSSAIGSGSTALESSTSIGALSASADSSIAIGRGASAIKNSISIGNDSVASGNNSIALGKGSFTNQDNTISFGNKTTTRKLINISKGDISENSSHAINGSQLFYTNKSIQISKQEAIQAGASAAAQVKQANNQALKLT